jgi:hypothetical protein
LAGVFEHLGGASSHLAGVFEHLGGASSHCAAFSGTCVPLPATCPAFSGHLGGASGHLPGVFGHLPTLWRHPIRLSVGQAAAGPAHQGRRGASHRPVRLRHRRSGARSRTSSSRRPPRDQPPAGRNDARRRTPELISGEVAPLEGGRGRRERRRPPRANVPAKRGQDTPEAVRWHWNGHRAASS